MRYSFTTNQCLHHGHPNDVLMCPKENCQGGKIPLWWGWGGPAGIEKCHICNGIGKMLRKDVCRYVTIPFSTAPCICRVVKEEQFGQTVPIVSTKTNGVKWYAKFDNIGQSVEGVGDTELMAVMSLWEQLYN